MTDQHTYDEEGGQFQDIEGAQYMPRVPYPFPLPLPRASGLYQWRMSATVHPRLVPERLPNPIGPGHGAEEPAESFSESSQELSIAYPWWFSREELRLDIDGRYPQMTASGTAIRGISTRVHWVASLAPSGANRWTGTIWYKEVSSGSFPYTNADVQVVRSWFSNQRRATLTLSGGGAPKRTLVYQYKSPYFRKVEFEYDRASDASLVTTVNTAAHPNRPATLATETLSVETVFRRAGFEVRRSGGSDVVPDALAGSNGTWSDNEMHDAMQAYWSRFSNRAQWSMWTFFAARHDRGSGLGGIMFDDIGSNHRQGTAIFTDSFISNPPSGDAHPDEWAQRMRFWTAVHEMGHAFNLAHSWQKALGTPWIALANEPETRSFMNYPYRVSGGQSAFFADFEYRFDDDELLFMRHAPERFVQMGNADWFDHHGFQQAEVSPEPTYQLQVRMNRDKPVLDFLEPLVLELKLTNVSPRVQLVAENMLSGGDNLTVILKNRARPRGSSSPSPSTAPSPPTWRSIPANPCTSPCSSPPAATAGMWPSRVPTRSRSRSTSTRRRSCPTRCCCGSRHRAGTKRSSWPRITSVTRLGEFSPSTAAGC